MKPQVRCIFTRDVPIRPIVVWDQPVQWHAGRLTAIFRLKFRSSYSSFLNVEMGRFPLSGRLKMYCINCLAVCGRQWAIPAMNQLPNYRPMPNSCGLLVLDWRSRMCMMSRSRVRLRITDLACRRNTALPDRVGCSVLLFCLRLAMSQMWKNSS